MENATKQWLDGLRCGDADAAQRLWDSYYPRMLGLARKKLRDSPRRSMDEEDVAVAAFQSFCTGLKAGRFPKLHDAERLWALLAVITARVAANQRLHEARIKRGGGWDVTAFSANGSGADAKPLACNRSSPDDSVIFFAELERFMDMLEDPSDRVVLLWKLEERSNPEIARHLDCSLSSVERRLRLIRKRLGSLVSPESASVR